MRRWLEESRADLIDDGIRSQLQVETRLGVTARFCSFVSRARAEKMGCRGSFSFHEIHLEVFKFDTTKDMFLAERKESLASQRARLRDFCLRR